MKNVIDFFVYLCHWPSAVSFEFNIDILATNLINISAVVGVLIFFWKRKCPMICIFQEYVGCSSMQTNASLIVLHFTITRCPFGLLFMHLSCFFVFSSVSFCYSTLPWHSRSKSTVQDDMIGLGNQLLQWAWASCRILKVRPSILGVNKWRELAEFGRRQDSNRHFSKSHRTLIDFSPVKCSHNLTESVRFS